MEPEILDREIVNGDVVFVGAGPACLAGAIHLQNLIESHNEQAETNSKVTPIENPKILILEKGSEVGAHGISGAVLDPLALNELIPDWRERDDFPLERWMCCTVQRKK